LKLKKKEEKLKLKRKKRSEKGTSIQKKGISERISGTK
jgi:hypothetical protein